MANSKRQYTVSALEYVGQEFTAKGWVDTIRDHGQLMFIDVRDSKGVLQVVVDASQAAETIQTAQRLGKEYVVAITGQIRERDVKLVNPDLVTGQIELVANNIEIISEAKVLPFPIDTDGHDIDEAIRLRYRYLDLRRPRLQKIMRQRDDLIHAVRNWFHSQDFLEVTTPLLTSTSPEGARDFLIPSRLYPGKFFVLPQAPQQFKQLLMVGGVDRYFQIAPCARDEDPRADRHAGVFYQIDVEISFTNEDINFDVCERMIRDTYQTVAPHKQIKEFPFPRISYRDADERFGSDKPDVRFELEMQAVTEIVKGKTEFNVFNNAEVVKCIVVPNAPFSRTEIEQLEIFAKEQGLGGLAYVKVNAGKLETGIAKFLGNVEADLIQTLGAEDGSFIFFAASDRKVVNKALGQVRLKLGDMLNLRNPNELAFVWITDFPFFEVDEKTGKLDFGHNPFSMPQGGMQAFDAADPLSIVSHQYDLALNGYEILSGSVRNHDPEIMVKAFEMVGYGREEVIKRFGALYNAFQYGVPPHGGWAIGIDRYFMILVDEPNIRDVYAFPMSSNGTDLLMNAPSDVREEDLKILGIQLRPEVQAKLAKQAAK
jgi:aspartyl-tRNA synthetase